MEDPHDEELPTIRILNDSIDTKPVLDFDTYSKTIVKIIKGSFPQFSIGIFGDWGTGKTTLMKLIENKLQTDITEQEVTWEGISGNNMEETNKLKNFLIQNFKIYWIGDLGLVKKDERKIELANTNTNNSSTKTFSKASFIQKMGLSRSNSSIQDDMHSLSLRLNEKQTAVTLTIDGKFVRKYDAEKMSGDITLHLKENKILTVWFNAWRYERENQYALVALMKTIAYEMGELPMYQEVKKVLLRGAIIIGKDVLRNLAIKYAMTQEGVKELEGKILPKMDILSKVDQETVYFEGLKTIVENMKEIAKTNRIVVFIDDLDRCSSNKALEVFESIKVFLDIEGFIFVIGLSHEKMYTLISKEFKKSGVTGQEYLRKIIQIPFTIPEWNRHDIESLIKDLLDEQKNNLDEKYHRLVDKNKELIARAVESNPRELKRFINSFIMAYENYSTNTEIKSKSYEFAWEQIKENSDSKFRQFVKKRWNLEWIETARIEKEGDNKVKLSVEDKFLTLTLNSERTRVTMVIENTTSCDFIAEDHNGKLTVYPIVKILPKELLLVQALKMRWEKFYRQFSLDMNFQNHIKRYTELEDEEKRKELFSKDTPLLTKENQERLSEFILKPEYRSLWRFLEAEKDTLFKIEDWEVYRRATETVKQIHDWEMYRRDLKIGEQTDTSTLTTEDKTIEPTIVYEYKIKVKQNWEDYVPQIYSKVGSCHALRTEHPMLVDFLLRRKEGSILISGRRGTGKTSIVISAIQEAKRLEEEIALEASNLERESMKVLFPVIVNGTNFENVEGRVDEESIPEFKQRILEYLVKRLYQEAIKAGLVSQPYRVRRGLLKKSAEFEGVSNEISVILQSLFRKVTAKEVRQRIVESDNPGALNRNELNKDNEAAIFYKYNYDVDALQTDLMDTLCSMARENYKVIFVIDELDNVEEDVANLIIKSISALLNVSCALFVLISGAKFYINSMNREERSYTLFSQKIYIPKPSFDLMRRFIDNILEYPNADQIRSDSRYEHIKTAYHTFQNYACFASKSEFYDLYNILRDYMIRDSTGGLLLNIAMTRDRKITNSASLQEILEIVYERKKHHNSSFFYVNDRLLDLMYSLLSPLMDPFNQAKYIQTEKDPLFKVTFLNDKFHNIKDITMDSTADLERDALIELINVLYEKGLLKETQTSDIYEISSSLKV